MLKGRRYVMEPKPPGIGNLLVQTLITGTHLNKMLVENLTFNGANLKFVPNIYLL